MRANLLTRGARCAFALANVVHEGLRSKFGDDWYGNKEVGAFLASKLFADGNKLQADEIAQLFGESKLTLGPSEKRFTRLLAK